MTPFAEWRKSLVEAFSAQSFPNIARNLDPKTAARFEVAMEKVAAAQAAGEISNPEFQEVKGVLSRIFEGGWKAAFMDPFLKQHGGAGGSIAPDHLYDIYWLTPLMHAIPGALKKLDKIKSNNPLFVAAYTFLGEFQNVAVQLASLKDKVYKGRKRAAPDPNAPAPFVPSPAALEDIKRISGLLTEITKEVADKQIQSIKSHLRQVLHHFMEKVKNGEVKVSPHHDVRYKMFSRDPYTRQVIGMLTDYDPPMERFASERKLIEKPDADAIMERYARREAEEMQQIFVSKNTAKLAPIVTKKASLADAKVIHADANRGTITGEMALSFKDGSKFVVRNSVVWSISIHHRPFYRFPTTFHDVYLADGTRMKMPSEEKMHKVFAGLTDTPKPDEEVPATEPKVEGFEWFLMRRNFSTVP